jgi:hypothetical protein
VLSVAPIGDAKWVTFVLSAGSAYGDAGRVIGCMGDTHGHCKKKTEATMLIVFIGSSYDCLIV